MDFISQTCPGKESTKCENSFGDSPGQLKCIFEILAPNRAYTPQDIQIFERYHQLLEEKEDNLQVHGHIILEVQVQQRRTYIRICTKTLGPAIFDYHDFKVIYKQDQ